MRVIPLETWKRRELYQFYRTFFCPLYNVSLEVDARHARTFCREREYSFFLFCLYVFLRGCNQVDNFRLRERDGQVVDLEVVDVITPIMATPDSDQFTMVHIPYQEHFAAFHQAAKKIIANAKDGVLPAAMPLNTACLNFEPWFSFTGITGGISRPHQDMTLGYWGKYRERDGQLILPYALQCNHAFIDGLHVGQYVAVVEAAFAAPETL